MKLRIISLCAAIAVCSVMKGQQTDPTLTGAVAAQTEILKKIFKDRENTQNKIIAAEAAVSVAMDRMHAVETRCLTTSRTLRVSCRTSTRSNVPPSLSPWRSHRT